jgi:hypothetical protein
MANETPIATANAAAGHIAFDVAFTKLFLIACRRLIVMIVAR